MNIIVDVLHLQHSENSVVRLWRDVLIRLARNQGVRVLLLDRGTSSRMEGVPSVPFPSYKPEYAADDSILLQRFCDYYQSDVFISTMFTTPLTTPAVQVVYDMAPENFELSVRNTLRREKEIAVSYSQFFLCTSSETRKNFLKYYSEIREENIIFSCPGCADCDFTIKSSNEVADFMGKFNIRKPYVLIASGWGECIKDKAVDKTVEALFSSELDGLEFVLLDVCGIERREYPSPRPGGAPARLPALGVYDLSCAYSGAQAFVYPSLLAGDVTPVIEALACGCPVFTIDNAPPFGPALSKVCTNIPIGRMDILVEAMKDLQNSKVRNLSGAASISTCGNLSWIEFIDDILALCRGAIEYRNSDLGQKFHLEWKRLRVLQAETNTQTLS
jgi:glycosyltransferase involved in cell wall biosynthesis